jgi:hypothetical protein
VGRTRARDQDDALDTEVFGGASADNQVAVVNRIERPAEE